MNKTYFLGLGVAALMLPITAFGATYFYVDTAGKVQNIEAANADAALTLSANDRAVDSGVAVDLGFIEEGDTVPSVVLDDDTSGATNGMTRYQYVTTQGSIATVYAANAADALRLATNIHTHSGVVYAGVDPI